MAPPKRESRLALNLSLITAAILALLPLHPFFTTWIASNTGHFDLIRIWKELIIVLILMPGALILAWRDKRLWSWLIAYRVMWLFAAYEILHLLLGFWALRANQVSATALIYALIINLRFIAFFLVCAMLAAKSDLLKRWWLRLILIPGAITIAFGLMERFILPLDFLRHFGYGPSTIKPYQTVDSNSHYLRVQSTLRGPNPFGAYLSLVLAMAAGLLRGWKRGAYLLLGLIALFYSYSRSGWVGLALSLLLLTLWLQRKREAFYKILALTAVLIAILGVGVYVLRTNQAAQDTIFHTSSGSRNTSSNEQRAGAIKEGFMDIVHQPLGRGPGSAGPASTRNTGHAPRIAEDYYIQLGQEVGVLGVLIFIAINILVAVELWARRGDTLAKLLLATLVGITFINLVSHAWADDTLSLLWWGLAGIELSPILVDRRKQNGKKAKTT